MPFLKVTKSGVMDILTTNPYSQQCPEVIWRDKWLFRQKRSVLHGQASTVICMYSFHKPRCSPAPKLTYFNISFLSKNTHLASMNTQVASQVAVTLAYSMIEEWSGTQTQQRTLFIFLFRSRAHKIERLRGPVEGARCLQSLIQSPNILM